MPPEDLKKLHEAARPVSKLFTQMYLQDQTFIQSTKHT